MFCSSLLICHQDDLTHVRATLATHCAEDSKPEKLRPLRLYKNILSFNSGYIPGRNLSGSLNDKNLLRLFPEERKNASGSESENTVKNKLHGYIPVILHHPLCSRNRGVRTDNITDDVVGCHYYELPGAEGRGV